MKKRKKGSNYLLLAAVVIFAFSGCGQNVSDETQSTEPAVSVFVSGETATPIPTEMPEPEATPDADPLGKMSMTQEDLDGLLSLWPVADMPLADQGNLLSFSINAQAGMDKSTLNFTFSSDKTEDELKEMYGAVISGEWEEEEFSYEGTVYAVNYYMDGMTADGTDATCYISESESGHRIFLSFFTEGGTEELDAVFESHLPVGLIPLYEALNDDSLFMVSLTYTVGETLTLQREWAVESGVEQDALAFYENELADCEDYVYTEGDEYSEPSIQCTISGIGVAVHLYSGSNNLIIISYGCPIGG